MAHSHLNQPHFQNAEKAREYLESVRWADGPVCPHCGSVSRDHYALKGKAHRPGLWKCKDCREQFSVTVGTVFERSKIPLNIWLQAVFLLCSSKKGMSSHQLHRTLGVTYKTAWFMTHRIREAFKSGGLTLVSPLGGSGKVVEADETYIGRAKGGRRAKRKGGNIRRVLALVERDGQTRSYHVADVTASSLKPVLLAQLHKDTHLMTDGAWFYKSIGPSFKAHESVNHMQGEYARKSKVKGLVAHTNTVESYFSLLKRGLYGTYHHVSEAHLQRYCHEFDFRFSHRASQGYTDKDRADIALSKISGKRLTYRRISRPEEAPANDAH
jgi:transposase-like protein